MALLAAAAVAVRLGGEHEDRHVHVPVDDNVTGNTRHCSRTSRRRALTASRSRSSRARPTTTGGSATMLDRIGLERTAVSAMGDPSMNLIAPDAATRRRGIDYVKWAIDCSDALGATML